MPAERALEATRQRLHAARCFLFVPGDRPDRFSRALASDAHAVVFDLEASVAPGRRAQARAEVRAALDLARGERLAIVRVNPVTGNEVVLDAAVLRGSGCDAVMLSMTESAADVERFRHLLHDLPVVALVETAAGVVAAHEIARADGVERVAFGNMDYQTDTSTSGPLATVYPASVLVVASRAAGLPAPIAGVTAAFRDAAQLQQDLQLEQSLGFGAKLCIHPDQIAPIVAAWSVSASAVAWAERVLEAARESHAVEVDGELVDRPVIERARRLLARVRR
jgi:citrate lyase subunit beta/citryl-CoA lyase